VEGKFSEVPECRGSGKLASPGTFIADSSLLARVFVGWVYLLSSSFSFPELLVGFPWAGLSAYPYSPEYVEGKSANFALHDFSEVASALVPLHTGHVDQFEAGPVGPAFS
jgi:hypothetical protein